MFSPIANATQTQPAARYAVSGQDSTETRPHITTTETSTDIVQLSSADKAELAALEHQIPYVGVVTHGAVLDAAAIAAYAEPKADNQPVGSVRHL